VVQEVETGLQILLRQLLVLRYAHPNRVTMAIYSENKEALFELAQAYYSAALGTQMQVTVSYYTTNPAVVQAVLESQPERPKKADEDDPKMFGRRFVRQETNKPAEFLSNQPEATTGIVLSVEGKSAYAKCLGEHGPHAFVDGKTNNHVFVHVSDAVAKDYRVPSFLEKRGAIQPANAGVARRTYWRGGSYVEDHRLETRRDWRNDLPAVLSFFMERNLQHAAERLLEE
jgi:hypothetical protein